MNTDFRRKEGETWKVWGDEFLAVCIGERKLRSTTSSWKNLEVCTGFPWLRCQEQWLHKWMEEMPQKPLMAQEPAVGGARSQPGEGIAASLQWGRHRYWQQVDNALGVVFFPPEVTGKMGESSVVISGAKTVPASTVIVGHGRPLWLCSQKVCDKRSWKHFHKPSFVFCVTHEYVLWGDLLPVKGKIWGSASQQAASAICTTNLLVRVFMKLGRGCFQNNLVCSSLSSLVKGEIF